MAAFNPFSGYALIFNIWAALVLESRLPKLNAPQKRTHHSFFWQ
jgi:hypothetical protein